MSWMPMLTVTAVGALLLTACAVPPPPPPQAPVRSNPFMEKSPLPFEAPEFDKIQDSDYQPALEEGMKQRLADVDAIANNSAAPSFDNTIVALEKSGRLLDRVSQVFYAVIGANSNETLEKVQDVEAPKLTANSDAIFLNEKLFARVEAIYNQRNQLGLTPDAVHLVEVYYQQFVLAGAKLSEADKTRLKEINGKLAQLGASYTTKLLAAAKINALVIDDPAKLKGLSDGEIAAAAAAAEARGLKGKWVLSLQNTTQQPVLERLENRDTRAELFEHSVNRAERGDDADTRATIIQIAELRAEKAKLLGFDNFAGLALADQMAKTPAGVDKLLAQLVPATVKKAKGEAADIQAMIKKTGGTFKLAPWDWEYYAEKVRKAKYDLNQDEVKPYFELNNVLENGVFYAANKLYGISFKERKDIPTYHPDMRVFEVIDKDGSSIGLMYFDYFKRDNKQGGAWMSNMVGQSKLLGTKPVVYNVANFAKPAAGQPALISYDDVTTMFHEFGHALHGLFSNQTYPTIANTNVSRDFVEFPSQFNEHWASDPDVFKHYAVHYQTKAPMPEVLVAKIQKAAKFNQGYMLTELLAAASLDMQWHTIAAGAKVADVDAFEAKALKDTKLALAEVPPRYRSSYFLHIWGNGYAAGYYAYLWAEMLDDDAYAWFMSHGGMTRENGQRYRDMILSRGNSEDLAQMYRAFAGRDPLIHPLLVQRGLVAK
ncbi:MAG: peptidyl-dipeptidase Dcp [Rhizomicrobium sp.]